MKTKLSIFAITFVLSLALLSCIYAGDVNETAIGDDQVFIEDSVVCEENVVYEDEIAEVSLSSPDSEITPEEENTVVDIADNNDTTSFEIVNNAEHSEKSDFDTVNYETPDTGFFNDGQFFDMNLEFYEKFDAAFNDNMPVASFIKINIPLDGVAGFEVFMIKMEDFNSSLVKEGKLKNSFAFKHELMVHVLHNHNFENFLDCDIVICSNKLSDNFAYSINNSIIGDESGVIYRIFNLSYQNFTIFN